MDTEEELKLNGKLKETLKKEVIVKKNFKTN